MIRLENVKQYCKEYWKIKNYQEAVNDKTQTWHCHHIHELDWALPKEELIAIGRYYDVHYSELIFLTPEEHNRLHAEGENNPMYGRSHTEETKQKISESVKKRGGHSGENNPNYKYHITAEVLHDLYVVQDLSAYRIAKIYGCYQTCIMRKLKKYNIIKNAR